jgi:hypothetical protein
MQALVLSTRLIDDRTGFAVPNDQLPNMFEEINWHALGANVAEAAATTAVVVGAVVLLFAVLGAAKKHPAAELALHLIPNISVGGNVQIGAGYGVLCPGGVPVSFDGKPLTNEAAAAFASACWKEQHAVTMPNFVKDRSVNKVVDLDYQQALLPYKVLNPGESAVGLQFFQLGNGITDWGALALDASVPDGTMELVASSLPHATATIDDSGFFLGDAGVRIELPEMPAASCGFAKEGGRFKMTFRDTYGENVMTQKLDVVLDSTDLPAPGSTWTFSADNSNQHVALLIGKDIRTLNGEWRSYIGGRKASRCTMTVDDSGQSRRTRRLIDERGGMRFLDEFFVKARLDCERVSDWDVGTTDAWLKFTADLSCRGALPR